eukprot:COSAG02_NODE_12321_length_1562_cov_2.619959_3_plen_109_part_00
MHRTQHRYGHERHRHRTFAQLSRSAWFSLSFSRFGSLRTSSPPSAGAGRATLFAIRQQKRRRFHNTLSCPHALSVDRSLPTPRTHCAQQNHTVWSTGSVQQRAILTAQ